MSRRCCHAADVKAAFNDRHVAYLVADWTNRNDDNHQAARARMAVPACRFISITRQAADKPVILPQILTESGVLDAIKG